MHRWMMALPMRLDRERARAKVRNSIEHAGAFRVYDSLVANPVASVCSNSR
jgi:hypothetical protein